MSCGCGCNKCGDETLGLLEVPGYVPPDVWGGEYRGLGGGGNRYFFDDWGVVGGSVSGGGGSGMVTTNTPVVTPGRPIPQRMPKTDAPMIVQPDPLAVGIQPQTLLIGAAFVVALVLIAK